MITREELAARIYERSIHNEKKVKDAQNRAEKFGNPHNHKRPVGIELAHMAFNAAEDFLTVMRVRSKNPIPQQAVLAPEYVEGGVGYRMGIDPAGDGEDKTVEATKDTDGNIVYVHSAAPDYLAGDFGNRRFMPLGDVEDKTVAHVQLAGRFVRPDNPLVTADMAELEKKVLPPVLDAADAFRKRPEERDALERSLVQTALAGKPLELEDVKAATPDQTITQFQDEFMIGGASGVEYADLKDRPDWAMTGRVSAPLERFTPTAKTLDQNAAKKWQEANPKAIKGAAQNPAFKSDPKGPFWFISDGEGRKYQRWTKDGFAQHFGPHFVAGTLETEAAMLRLCPVAVRAFAAFIS